jgi:general secretion pathway protein D
LTGRGSLAARAVLACAMLLLAGAADAQPPQPAPPRPPQPQSTESTQRITPNFKDADITQIAEAVSAATGKNFIIDPRVRAQVTMLSSTPMSPDAFYQAFLSILQVHGFVALPAGKIIKIVPDANARQYPSNDLPDHVSSSSDEIVTQVIAVKSVNAAQLVPILRPLIPQYGHLAAYPASNILIISDRANNVNRIMRIIQRIDQVGDSDVEIVPLQNASATEIVRVINSLYQQQSAAEGGAATGFKLVADERSNSILLSGEKDARLRIRVLIAHLDTPLQSGGDTQVRYLQNADAEKIAAKLKEQIAGASTGAPGAPGAPGGAAAQAERGTIIWADPATNALIITATPKVMRNLMSVIDKLDIRRAQVLVEAIIVDVDLSKSASLGVNWAVYGQGSTAVPAAAFNSPVNGTSIADVVELVASPTTALANGTSIPTGGILGIGRVASNGLNFGALLSAIRSDTNSNVVATPSAVTTDNQEATLKVASEVPFLTGQFTSTGSSNSSVTPFQTIQREEVGTILKITPQINEGGAAVMLKIDLESSSVVPKDAGPEGAVDLTTTKRTVSTRVLIEDGGIVVLGGLTNADYSRQETRVPFLGAIPFLGQLFKTRSGSADRTDLMVFIRPKILRTDEQSAIETNTKYNYIREEQRKVTTGEKEWLPILPGVKQPELPPMAPATQSTTPAPTSTAEKEKAGEEERRLRTVTPPPAGKQPAASGTPPSTDTQPAEQPFTPTPNPPSTDTGHQ